MTITAVSECAQCGAVVNIHWASCLVCHVELANSHDVAPASQTSPGSESISPKPLPPILPGWLVTYRDESGKLSGGVEDPDHGTVQECRWDFGRWTVYLTDGQRLPLSRIRGVGKTDEAGQILAAWTTKEHGLDGKGLNEE